MSQWHCVSFQSKLLCLYNDYRYQLSNSHVYIFLFFGKHFTESTLKIVPSVRMHFSWGFSCWFWLLNGTLEPQKRQETRNRRKRERKISVTKPFFPCFSFRALTENGFRFISVCLWCSGSLYPVSFFQTIRHWIWHIKLRKLICLFRLVRFDVCIGLYVYVCVCAFVYVYWLLFLYVGYSNVVT